MNPAATKGKLRPRAGNPGSTKTGSKRTGSKKLGAKKTVSRKPADIRRRIEAAIRSIPRGKVSTYGAVARAAGFPGAARQVAATLRRSYGLSWQRVLGSGGEIKMRGDSAIEQRLRLQAEGVRFRGRKVDMKQYEWKFRSRTSDPSR
jgi:methylated-DNA-protein-cysteine methyltransferase-like protein